MACDMAVVAGLTMRAMSVYTATEAAKLCGVSLRTVQRKSAQLEAAGAWKDTSGQWQIPMAAMRTSGLVPGRPTGPDTAPSTSRDKSGRQHDSSDKVTAIIAQYKVTEQYMAQQLSEWRRRAEVAEVQAAERQKIIDIQDRALRVLEEAAAAAAPTPPTPPPAPEPSSPDSVASRRPFWFRRRRQSVHA